LKEVLNDLEVLIKNNNATIQALPLPVIEANAIQIHQLFQNIITNAIKFRKRNVAAQIIISSEIIVGEKNEKPLNINAGLNLPILNNSTFWQTEKFCRITIKDNGIGFDESYLEKIFVIFQRLHTKTEYEGTGIGLATCKKIVDKHHGIITGKSKPGEGF